ncbi:hypothetical protein BDV98DRAFT_482129, partial [Pterulicium gracile]
LVVSSESLGTNCIALKSAFMRVNKWLKSAGLSADLAKRELMPYTRSRKNDSPIITFDDDNGVTRCVAAEKSVCWLGAHFDKKLLFHEHVRITTAKADCAVKGLQIMGNTLCGMNAIHLRHLHILCIMPLFTYAAAVWWTGKRCHLEMLEK